jgi:hypothetical protein
MVMKASICNLRPWQVQLLSKQLPKLWPVHQLTGLFFEVANGW